MKVSLVNLTVNMRCKNDKHYQIRFFQAQNAPKSVFGYYPSPFSFPLDAFGVSKSARLRRLGSQAPSTQNPGYASDFGTTKLVPKCPDTSGPGPKCPDFSSIRCRSVSRLVPGVLWPKCPVISGIMLQLVQR